MTPASAATLTPTALRQLREEAGLTPAELARRLDMAEADIVAMEAGEAPIGVRTALAARYLLEVQPAVDTAEHQLVAWINQAWTGQVASDPRDFRGAAGNIFTYLRQRLGLTSLAAPDEDDSPDTLSIYARLASYPLHQRILRLIADDPTIRNAGLGEDALAPLVDRLERLLETEIAEPFPDKLAGYKAQEQTFPITRRVLRQLRRLAGQSSFLTVLSLDQNWTAITDFNGEEILRCHSRTSARQDEANARLLVTLLNHLPAMLTALKRADLPERSADEPA